MALFSAAQPVQQPTGNGEKEIVRVSLIQGVLNKVQEANNAKQEAIDLLDDLKGWLIRSLERDIGFADRLVRAVEDNAPEQIEATLLEENITKIAEKFAHREEDSATDNAD